MIGSILTLLYKFGYDQVHPKPSGIVMDNGQPEPNPRDHSPAQASISVLIYEFLSMGLSKVLLARKGLNSNQSNAYPAQSKPKNVGPCPSLTKDLTQ